MITEVIGWIGVSILLVAYFLVSIEKIKPHYAYLALNIVGALGVGVSALMKGAYPATALEAVWIAITIFAFIRLLRKPQPK